MQPWQTPERIGKTLRSVEGLERHEPSGQFCNWYDPATLDLLTTWPEPPHDPVNPFLSSVDNGWLAAALIMVAEAVPEHRDRAWQLATSMDFGSYYDEQAKGPDADAGLIRGGFWLESGTPPASDGFPKGDYCGMGETVVYTGHHYGSMFEALMPALVVPEEDWGLHSWAVTHPLYVESPIEYGLAAAGYGYWGFSPASNPAGGYREYGVDALGMFSDGYTSDVAHLTRFVGGWGDPDCPRDPSR